MLRIQGGILKNKIAYYSIYYNKIKAKMAERRDIMYKYIIISILAIIEIGEIWYNFMKNYKQSNYWLSIVFAIIKTLYVLYKYSRLLAENRLR